MITDTINGAIREQHNATFEGYTHSKKASAKNLGEIIDGFAVTTDSQTETQQPHIVYYETETPNNVLRTTFRIIPEINEKTRVTTGYTVVTYRSNTDAKKGRTICDNSTFTQALTAVKKHTR
jgi:hypothetical protein